ncbi:MAG TPA: DUF1700 domain-containing protein [Bacilli bacterium]|nr:DUF1700 domain-containing protein [Bacilli bacterium]HPS19341.1 DUF1700 domain-containing protein [Bacilli bacterium]
MTKNEFFEKLRLEIRNLPYDEVEKTITYYEEMISDRMEDGATEEEAVASLGTPEAIARDLQANQPFSTIIKKKVEGYKSKRNPENTALLIVLLIVSFPIWFPILMSAIGVIIGFFAAIGAIIVALWAVSVSFGIAGVGMIVASFFGFASVYIPTGFFSIGGGIALIGLSIISIIGAIYATKGIIKLINLLIHEIKKLFFRRSQA